MTDQRDDYFDDDAGRLPEGAGVIFVFGGCVSVLARPGGGRGHRTGAVTGAAPSGNPGPDGGAGGVLRPAPGAADIRAPLKPEATLSADRQRIHMRRGGWSIEFPVSELPRWLQLCRICATARTASGRKSMRRTSRRLSGSKSSWYPHDRSAEGGELPAKDSSPDITSRSGFDSAKA